MRSLGLCLVLMLVGPSLGVAGERKGVDPYWDDHLYQASENVLDYISLGKPFDMLKWSGKQHGAVQVVTTPVTALAGVGIILGGGIFGTVGKVTDRIVKVVAYPVYKPIYDATNKRHRHHRGK